MHEKFGKCSLDHVSIDLFHLRLKKKKTEHLRALSHMPRAPLARKKKFSQPNEVEPSAVPHSTVLGAPCVYHTVQNHQPATGRDRREPGGSPPQANLAMFHTKPRWNHGQNDQNRPLALAPAPPHGHTGRRRSQLAPHTHEALLPPAPTRHSAAHRRTAHRL